MVESASLWAVLAVLPLLGGAAVVAVCADRALAARAAGQPYGPRTIAAGVGSDTARLLVGQRRTTLAPDRLLWRLGLIAVPTAAVLAAAVIPFGRWAVDDLGVGVVWFNGMEIATWAALWAAGWGPNSVLSLVGGYRMVAQGLAYELPHMFALIGAATAAGSLQVGTIVAHQRHLWFAVWMPVGFVVYLLSVLGFSFTGPFDQPAGVDVAGGVFAEVAGPDRLILAAGRWLLLTAGAAMAVPLFLGGGLGPVLPAWAWSTVKTFAVLGVLVGVRRSVPTVRLERWMPVAWTVLIPLTIAQDLIAALVAVSR
ncbi:NADH-quinone oxidoreductase subunit H [Acidiferrimicrobium sp. IK]|uniref:complex I subunit 1 family protein n=1 Tax=Acidiferrimicrobium sp. IK TaxID=2871700 RepID=UPI0021CB829F|nr:complex I subunit 1 family protein [Acidiferrimicrobium sp. IK]MCU4185730.1 NADH-quinone oxidoreductase subunit H [Acidiferrimicrobium sp. IK]